jgi:hypothetical protein
MALELTALVQSARYAINDATQNEDFSDDQIEDWITQGIRDLNHHFPRRIAAGIDTEAGVQVYDLDVTYLGVVSAEYPTGETPRKYLKYMAYNDPHFWLSDGHYDFVRKFDSDSDNAPQLYISSVPADDETITLEVMAEHDVAASPLTVLERHVPLILQWVVWKSWEAMAGLEGKDPTLGHATADKYFMSARRAEQLYRSALKAAKDAESDGGIISGWVMDGHDRVY